MKLLLTSPYALFDKDGNFFDGIYDALIHWMKLEKDNTVVVISIHKEQLKNVPKEFISIPIDWKLRGSPRLIEIIKEETKLDHPDIIVLGANEKDMQTAANSKLILLNAQYAIENHPDDVIYTKEYGIPISDSQALIKFFNVFVKISEPWYYRLEVDNKTIMYALTDANTFYKGADEVALNNQFKELLKDGDTTYQREFMIYFLISTYSIFKEFDTVKYWGIYPSSGVAANPDLEYFLTKARQSYKSSQREPLLIRTKSTTKRHEKSKLNRLNDGCDSQFDSIKVSPYYLKGNKLRNACVCIIDDFSTYGTSCETVRALLEEAGVSKILFITMGKYGKEYNKYTYQIIGNIYDRYRYVRVGVQKPMVGTFNANSNKSFIDSLKGIK